MPSTLTRGVMWQWNILLIIILIVIIIWRGERFPKGMDFTRFNEFNEYGSIDLMDVHLS